ncbi:MAG TPA: hypothetical protein VKX16_08655 [Chloroflexota bacterium]|nr:hypothetical protein [Chloroflexota bacterium]
MEDSSPALLEAVAALTLEIDRLVIAGHRAAAPFARQLREELGLNHMQDFGVLPTCRRLLLVPHGMTLAEGLALNRYHPPEEVKSTLQRHVDEDLLTSGGSRYAVTPSGRMLLIRLTSMLQTAIDSLWTDGATVRGAVTAASALLKAVPALPRALYPAFSADRAGYLPRDASPAFRLWSTLGTLRYLRADAHALAWRDAGLSAPEIVALTGLCAGCLAAGNPESLHGPALLALHALASRGLAHRCGTWEATDAGRALRTAIELQTNECHARALHSLGTATPQGLVERLRLLPPT